MPKRYFLYILSLLFLVGCTERQKEEVDEFEDDCCPKSMHFGPGPG